MDDLTLLYYTDNTISDVFAKNIRKYLLDQTGGRVPIISVSQKPIDFGQNICVGQIGKSYYNCYKQIYIGALAARTKYIACCEDDTIYNLEHFSRRPSKPGVFSYNTNLWFLNPELFFWKKDGEEEKNRTGMLCCIAETESLVKTLAGRFDKFPIEPIPNDKRSLRFWQEPGRFEKKFNIPKVEVEYFETKDPVVVLNYRGSLGGKRVFGDGTGRLRVDSFPSTGTAKNVWDRFFNE